MPDRGERPSYDRFVDFDSLLDFALINGFFECDCLDPPVSTPDPTDRDYRPQDHQPECSTQRWRQMRWTKITLAAQAGITLTHY